MSARSFGRAGVVLLILPLVAVSTVACDKGFEPLSPGREALVSVAGYLDASADTQWIRVMSIRPLKTTSRDSSDARVTLTEVGSGRMITLRDSLVGFPAGGATTDTGTAFVHDFWTTERITPGATYRFAAARPGQPTAEAVVTVPERFALTLSLHQSKYSNDHDFARVSSVSYLPFSEQRLRFSDGCGSDEDTLRNRAARAENGTVTLPVGRDTVAQRGCGNPVVTRRHLWVAASESPWPVPEVSHLLGLGASERTSNVTNALGFLGGLLTVEVPYNSCTFAAQSKWPEGTSSGIPGPTQRYSPEWCELRFDSVSASSSGRVIESRCGDGPVKDATVRFTQLDDSARTQLATTAADGAFEFGALKPGVRYNLYVYAKLGPIGGGLYMNLYSTVDDTVTFSPGEHRSGDLYIQRLIACDQTP
jgi:hypothetical protein